MQKTWVSKPQKIAHPRSAWAGPSAPTRCSLTGAFLSYTCRKQQRPIRPAINIIRLVASSWFAIGKAQGIQRSRASQCAAEVKARSNLMTHTTYCTNWRCNFMQDYSTLNINCKTRWPACSGWTPYIKAGMVQYDARAMINLVRQLV